MECAAAATAAAASAPSAGARYPKGSGREDGSTARRRRRLRCSGAYKMNRERSDFLASSPTRSWTMSASMTTLSPARSVAEKERSSISRSMMVCSRRAPMFSTSRLICVASLAIRHLASSVNSSCTPSVNMRAHCCLMRLGSGSVRMVYMSFSVSGLSSTRIGRRPCSSASRSDGLQKWKAPEAIKRMWSVLTLPCFVVTVEPSSSGSKSRCTPSEEASAEPR
mmetsp:Transcript_11879/g.34785  ORF Transcript_11879/g.34785 Transcript_11879/m.34785 type:complete len:223 (+) Transcript_11879:194-862(+)